MAHYVLTTVAVVVGFQSLSLASSGPPITENAYCEKGNIPRFGEKDGPAELPKSCYYTALDGTPSPGKQIRVGAGANLYEAIDRAKCGDALLLPAGASFEIKDLPKKGCDDQHYVTVRTDTPDSKLPPEGSRISPAWAGVASLPGRPPYAQPSGGAAKLMVTILLKAVPFTTIGDHYRFIGIEWTSSPNGKAEKFINTNGADHVIFDRNWFHAGDGVEVSKGVLMNGDTHFVAVVNSYFSNFNCVARSGSCTDASAIGGGVASHGSDTITTLKIYNNYLEASGENILFGGGGGETNPTDIEVRRNHLFKPLIWKEGEQGYTPAPSGDPYIVKNNFELKNARRVLVEANLFENSWGGFTQKGFSILMTPMNQNGHCPKCLDLDITLRYNRIRNVAGGFEIGTTISKKTASAPADGGRISIHDLIIDSVHNEGWIGKGTFMSTGSHQPPLHDIALDHITAFTTGSIFQVTSQEEKIYNFSLTNSIINSGGDRPEITAPGGKGNHCASGVQRLGPEAVLKACFENYRIEKNLIVGRGGWPRGNTEVSSLEAGGLRSLENGISKDPRPCRAQAPGCRKPSPAINAGTDGKDLGADVDAVDAALAGVE